LTVTRYDFTDEGMYSSVQFHLRAAHAPPPF